MSTLLSTSSSHSNGTKKDTSSFCSIAAEIRELGPFIHPPCPNPAPLGLFAFGLTTALLLVKHTRLGSDTQEESAGVDNRVWGFAVFFGGESYCTIFGSQLCPGVLCVFLQTIDLTMSTALTNYFSLFPTRVGLLQIIVGLVEIKRNNVFGFTAFCTYGGFWLSLATAHILIDDNTEVLFNTKAVQSMLVLMGVFTLVMWLCTFKMNMTINVLFFLLASTFFLLAGGVENETVDKAAGWLGMATTGTVYWLGAAELINDVIGGGNDIIPLGRFRSNK